jgi:small conductance mechanosensitive channel
MARELAQRMRVETAKHVRSARRQTIVLLALIGGIFAAYSHRRQFFGLDEEVRTGCVIAMALVGWVLARALGRAVGPALLRHLGPGRAGTVSFLIRLLTLGVVLVTALRIAGIDLAALAVGGAMTAVVLGLAAQQTFGNLVAGTVLLSAGPFKVGDLIRLQTGGVGGEVEGTVSSLGLLHTTLSRGADRVLVPNSVVLAAAIIPLREPSSVGLRAELKPGARIIDVQALLEEEVSTPTRSTPHIDLEEVDAERVVVRIAATPRSEADGAKLADELLAAVAKATEAA